MTALSISGLLRSAPPRQSPHFRYLWFLPAPAPPGRLSPPAQATRSRPPAPVLTPAPFLTSAPARRMPSSCHRPSHRPGPGPGPRRSRSPLSAARRRNLPAHLAPCPPAPARFPARGKWSAIPARACRHPSTPGPPPGSPPRTAARLPARIRPGSPWAGRDCRRPGARCRGRAAADRSEGRHDPNPRMTASPMAPAPAGRREGGAGVAACAIRIQTLPNSGTVRIPHRNPGKVRHEQADPAQEPRQGPP